MEEPLLMLYITIFRLEPQRTLHNTKQLQRTNKLNIITVIEPFLKRSYTEPYTASYTKLLHLPEEHMLRQSEEPLYHTKNQQC